MDKWVNYRGEILLPSFSFMSAESFAQSGNSDFENVFFRDQNFGVFTQSFGCLTGT
jgi:hypothetical protein